MKTRYNILYISVLFLTGMTACAKEDTLTPEVDTNIDCFAPAADAMDEESVLRRTFFEQENCYLLFSDTLRREELGKDSNGDMQYFIELLDVNYSVGASTNSSLTYSYKLLQSMEEKKQATSFFARVCIASLVRVYKTILLVFVNGYPISGRYDGRIDDLYSHGFR